MLGAGGAPGVAGVNVAETVTKRSFVACLRRNFRQSWFQNKGSEVNEKTVSSWKGTTEDGIRQAMTDLNMGEVV